MIRTVRLGFALTASIALLNPLPAFAQHRGGGGGGGGHPAPAHASAPAPAPRAVHAPSRPAAPAGGFDLHEDITPASRPAAPVRPATPVRASGPVSHMDNRPIASHTADRTAPAQGRPAAPAHRPTLIANLGYKGNAGNHRVISDPHYHGGSWGWNHGVTWDPAPRYYGGGFWGPFALGFAAAAVFGTLDYDDETLTSYQVEADSPGAQLLENYQLTQEACGPPDLVVIFGPDNSVICADPNDLVAAGEYQLDPSDLTIVSLDS